MRKKILVVGGSGRVGSELCYRLRDIYQIYSTLASESAAIDGVIQWPLVLGPNEALGDLIHYLKPDAILYCVGIPPEKMISDSGLAKHIYCDLIEDVAGAATKIGAKVLYFSNAEVFWGDEGNYSEEASLKACTAEGLLHQKAEEVLAAHENVLTCRFDQLITLSSFRHHSLGSRIIKQQEELYLPNDLTRTFLSGSDLASVIYQILETDWRNQNTFHLGTTEKLSLYEYGIFFANVLGVRSDHLHPCTTKEYYKNRNDILNLPTDLSLNCDKFSRDFGFKFQSIGSTLDQLKWDCKLGIY